MPITLNIVTEGPPKRAIIEFAFSEIGAAGYEFGRTPEEVADALGHLNAMMAEWKAWRGIDLNYDQTDYGTGSPDSLSGIPFEALNTVGSFLALRICPMMGASLSPESKGNLARSLTLLEAQYATIPAMPFEPRTPRGIGAEHARLARPGPFIEEDYDTLNPPPTVP